MSVIDIDPDNCVAFTTEDSRRIVAWGEAYARERAAFHAVLAWREVRRMVEEYRRLDNMHPCDRNRYYERLQDAEEAAIDAHRKVDAELHRIGHPFSVIANRLAGFYSIHPNLRSRPDVGDAVAKPGAE